MKKAIIKNIKLPYPEFNWDMMDEENKLLERIEEYRHLYGKSERWILADSEPYEPSDVLQTEERISEITGESSSWVLLRAEYTIEIEDITDQLNKQNRITELKKLLADSDFRMTTDYYKRMTSEKQNYWDDIRESWRSELRSLGV